MKKVFLSILPLIGLHNHAQAFEQKAKAFTINEIRYFNSLKQRNVLTVDQNGNFKLDELKLLSQIKFELNSLEQKSKNSDFKSIDDLLNALKPNNYYNLNDDAQIGNHMSFDRSEK